MAWCQARKCSCCPSTVYRFPAARSCVFCGPKGEGWDGISKSLCIAGCALQSVWDASWSSSSLIHARPDHPSNQDVWAHAASFADIARSPLRCSCKACDLFQKWRKQESSNTQTRIKFYGCAQNSSIIYSTAQKRWQIQKASYRQAGMRAAAKQTSEHKPRRALTCHKLACRVRDTKKAPTSWYQRYFLSFQIQHDACL